MMATQKDRLYTAFMSIKKNLQSGNDAAAFKTLNNIVKSEVVRATKAKRPR